jgi:phage terminase large subunit
MLTTSIVENPQRTADFVFWACTDCQAPLNLVLEQIKGRSVEKDGKLTIVAKDEIKEHIGRSPDYADAISMRLWLELTPKPIEFSIAFF